MGVILSTDQAKAYIPVEHAGHDDLIDDLILQAEGRMQSYMRVPIQGEAVTEYYDGGTSVLFLTKYPVLESSVTVVDTQGTNTDDTDDVTLAATEYRIYPLRGEILKTSSNGHRSQWYQGRRRFKVTYTAGLDQHPDWESFIRPTLRGSLRDLVAEWYINRSPGMAQESEGGGMGRTGFQGGLDAALPPRIREVWDMWSCPLMV